ncbi:MAG: molybdate ABC transporter substrate-binding protein [Chloroflexi bacterium]|nr:molybdate ABC transporter substrate-binding protein [Chloroflexota bacterium]
MLVLAAACAPRQPDQRQLLVFAAASLTDSLTELAEEYERTHGTEVSFSFGASQSLAQQIASGAPADLFLAAGMFPVDSLRERNHIEGDVEALLSNKLVVVTAPDVPPISSLGNLADESIERIAVADPEIAPAGSYARESLRSLGLWEGIRSKLIFGADVRATLAYVEAGNVDVALVYSTDAQIADSLTVLDIVPLDSYTPIIYPAAIPLLSDKKEAAREFLAFLKGEKAMKVFARHGFGPAPDSR